MTRGKRPFADFGTSRALEIVPDPGTLQYEGVFNEDGIEAVAFEPYRDADAALAHFVGG